MKCQKCREKMVSVEGRVRIQIGETVLETVADIFRCEPCDLNTAQIQVNMKPLSLEKSPFEKIGEEINGR